MSLQNRSIRRIWEFISQTVDSLSLAITITQSLSTDAVFTTEHSFSTQARNIFKHSGVALLQDRRLLVCFSMSQRNAHERTTAPRCQRIEERTTFKRSPLSIIWPQAGAKIMAEAARIKAYLDTGRSVPGKMVAIKRAAPNSNP